MLKSQFYYDNLCIYLRAYCLKSSFSQDERRWTQINHDEVFFDRLADRAYQPVNIQPFGHSAIPCCRQALNVSFIADLSQWGKQFYLYLFLSFHLCPSACINVTTAFFNCLKASFSQDVHGWTQINHDEVSFDRLADRAYQPVNIQPFGRKLVPDRPYGLCVSFIADLSQWRKLFNGTSSFIISSVSICVHHCYKWLFQLFKIFFFTGWTQMNADKPWCNIFWPSGW